MADAVLEGKASRKDDEPEAAAEAEAKPSRLALLTKVVKTER